MVLYISEVDALKELVDGLKRAAACSHGLAHYQQNDKWLEIRDRLEIMVVACQELATAKSLPRQQLLENLDFRQKNAPKDINGN